MSGKLNPGADPVRTFIDTFPAGTLSGASRRVETTPKRKPAAMAEASIKSLAQ